MRTLILEQSCYLTGDQIKKLVAAVAVHAVYGVSSMLKYPDHVTTVYFLNELRTRCVAVITGISTEPNFRDNAVWGWIGPHPFREAKAFQELAVQVLDLSPECIYRII